MKSDVRNIVKVAAAGFVVLTIMSVLLFWARTVCRMIFYENQNLSVPITPSGLTPQLDSDPNIVFKSEVRASISRYLPTRRMGIDNNIGSLENRKTGEFCLSWPEKDKGVFLVLFDKKLGQFLYYLVTKGKRGWEKIAKLYAGPNGISEIANTELGRFSEPDNNLWVPSEVGSGNPFIFFDKSQHSFYKIGFADKLVTKGGQISEDYKPAQMGRYYGPDKYELSISLWFQPPLRKQTQKDIDDKKEVFIRVNATECRAVAGCQLDNEKDVFYPQDGNLLKEEKYVSALEKKVEQFSRKFRLIVRQNGEIRRLDDNTLELSGPVGYLPAAVDSVSQARPDELFAYRILPLTVEDKPVGTIVGSVSQEGMQMQVAVFDKDGKLLAREGSYIDPFEKAGGPLLVTLTYLLENLQPAILGMASYVTASSFEAAASWRGIFILPNSIVAIIGRDMNGIVGPFFMALLIILPSLLLGAFLGWRVYKDAVVVGLSARARRWWFIGTVLFGLSAYITYRLTKPKERLVTCQNCGQLRRPDGEKCHRCGVKWHVAELIPPLWRVMD